MSRANLVRPDYLLGAVLPKDSSSSASRIVQHVVVLRDHKLTEPYWLLDQQGLPFANGATTADVEDQLAESCKLILAHASDRDVIFDRCALDFLAYLEVVSASEGFEWLPSGRQLTSVSKALAMLDLVVFVPLAHPDEIPVQIELPRLRSRVDRRLKAMLREDDLGL